MVRGQRRSRPTGALSVLRTEYAFYRLMDEAFAVLFAVANSDKLLRLSGVQIDASMHMPQCYGATEAEFAIIR
jgi:hypothetical protein